MAHRPAGQLEELHRSRRCLHARHQLRQRDDLLVDAKDPRLDVGIVLVRNVIDGEHRSVLFRMAPFGPEGRVLLLERMHQWAKHYPYDSVRLAACTYRVEWWLAEHDYGGTFVIVNERPELTARLLEWPFRDDVLPRFRVPLVEEPKNRKKHLNA